MRVSAKTAARVKSQSRRGVCLESSEERYFAGAFCKLYESASYPLRRCSGLAGTGRIGARDLSLAASGGKPPHEQR